MVQDSQKKLPKLTMKEEEEFFFLSSIVEKGLDDLSLIDSATS